MKAEEIAEVVRSSPRVVAAGGGTKGGLAAAADGAQTVDLRGSGGIVEYDPGEYTVTARAGTALKEIEEALAMHGQYLPFDPPLASAGATLGGTIAAGLSGPGRYRFGGVRDFILQVRWVTGKGEVVRAGAKVVKNAAGFDVPKLMVGSLGRLGILTEASFKVFPRPAAYATWQGNLGSLNAAVQAGMRLGRAPFDIEALDYNPDGTIWVRLGGDRSTFKDRLTRLGLILGAEGEFLEGEEEKSFWTRRRDELGGAHGPHALSGAAGEPRSSASGRCAPPIVKVPMTPTKILSLDPLLETNDAKRIYMAGGQALWVSWPKPVAELDTLLRGQSLAGLIVAGATTTPQIGLQRGTEFYSRVKSALDPDNKFGGW